MKTIALIAFRADDHKTSDPVLDNTLTQLSEFKTDITFFSADAEINFENQNFDALILYTNLKSVDSFRHNPQFEALILPFYQQSKPIGAIGSVAVLVAHALKKHHPLIAINESLDLITALQKNRIQYEICPSNDYITDRDCKLLSTPANMNTETSLEETCIGVRLLLKELVEMA
jgi:enhancing lycopene biosynthesis protein 2